MVLMIAMSLIPLFYRISQPLYAILCVTVKPLSAKKCEKSSAIRASNCVVALIPIL